MKKREILLGNPAFKKFNRTLMIADNNSLFLTRKN